jgi:hypothetical protein
LQRARPHHPATPFFSLQGLRTALDDDGYIYIKAFFPPGSVEAAGGLVMDHLAAMGSVLDPAFPPGSGILRERCGMGCLPFLEGKNELTQSPAIAGVIAGDALSEFMAQLLVREMVPSEPLSHTGPSLLLLTPVYRERRSPLLSTSGSEQVSCVC